MLFMRSLCKTGCLCQGCTILRCLDPPEISISAEHHIASGLKAFFCRCKSKTDDDWVISVLKNRNCSQRFRDCASANAGSARNKAAAAAVSRRYGSAAAAFADGLPPPDTSQPPAYATEAAPEREERSEKKVRSIHQHCIPIFVAACSSWERGKVASLVAAMPAVLAPKRPWILFP